MEQIIVIWNYLLIMINIIIICIIYYLNCNIERININFKKLIKIIKIIKIKNNIQNDYKNYNELRIQDINTQLENIKVKCNDTINKNNYNNIPNNNIQDLNKNIYSTPHNKYLHLKSPMKINKGIKIDEYDFNKLLNTKKYD